MMPFPPPQPPTIVPYVGGEGVSGNWAYAYVSQAGFPVPANSVSTLCAVTVGPGVWKFHAVISTLLNPGTGTAPWSADLISAAGGTDYYGASTGTVASIPQTIAIPVLGIGAFTAPTEVHLRWWSRASASFVAATNFDTGPTVLLIAERISESTDALA